jgi:AraC-like DNA-binding protein/uncharacterized cupin superfamily protein
MSYYPPLPADPAYDPSPAGSEGRSSGPLRSHEYTRRDEGRSRDLVLYYAGYQRCTPGHAWSSLRDHYLVHLVFEGRGAFTEGGTRYGLEAGTGFLIRPGIVSSYKADVEQPWAYGWFGFSGCMAGRYCDSVGLERSSPVFRFDLDGPLPVCVSGMNDPPAPGPGREPYLLKLLYEFFFLMAERSGGGTKGRPQPNETEAFGTARAGESGPERRPPAAAARSVQERYVEMARAYLLRNYSRPIRVEGVAAHAGISRKYLSSLFRARVGRSPQEFLLDLRMDKAAELLTDRNLPVKVVANSVGYADPLRFSRAFKLRKGLSPTEFRSIPKPGIRIR